MLIIRNIEHLEHLESWLPHFRAFGIGGKKNYLKELCIELGLSPGLYFLDYDDVTISFLFRQGAVLVVKIFVAGERSIIRESKRIRLNNYKIKYNEQQKILQE